MTAATAMASAPSRRLSRRRSTGAARSGVDAAGRANVPRIGWLRNVRVGTQIAQPVTRVILPISLG